MQNTSLPELGQDRTVGLLFYLYGVYKYKAIKHKAQNITQR